MTLPGTRGSARRATPVVFALTLGGLTLGAEGLALAQSDRELATRQELISQATDLADHGKHAEALALAKRAAAIKPTPSLRLFLAGEEAALGLVADAYGSSRQCAVEAEANARLNDRERVLAACKQLSDSLATRVGRVTIKLPPLSSAGLASLRVTIAGEEVNAALLGTPYIVSPGKLSLLVTAAGYLPYRGEIEVAEGGAAEVVVPFVADPTLERCTSGQERVNGACVAVCEPGRVREAGGSGGCVEPPIPPATRAVEPTAPAKTLSSRAIAGLGVAGVGLVAVGVGTYFGITALGKNGDSAPHCGIGGVKDDCDAIGVGLRSDAVSAATLSTVFLGVGAAAVVGGVVVWLSAPGSPLRANVAFDGHLLTLRGTF